MTDRIQPEVRSRIMRRVRAKDTKSEMAVRRLVHGLGYRYRLHARNLPGTPDLVFAARKKAIFVHGCFWHQHNCRRGTRPSSNLEFWNVKLELNTERDRRTMAALKEAGWSVLVIWECETRLLEPLITRIKGFLGQPGQPSS